MEIFSALLAICAGNSPVPVSSPHIGQWRGALMFTLICVWINGCVNNREAGDLRRYCAHYGVTVMSQEFITMPNSAYLDYIIKFPLSPYISANISKNTWNYTSHTQYLMYARQKKYSSLIAGIVCLHYDDVIMSTIASQITSLTIVYSTVYSGADQSKHQSSALLAFVWGIHRGPVNSPHKWPVTRKTFPFDDVIMMYYR